MCVRLDKPDIWASVPICTHFKKRVTSLKQKMYTFGQAPSPLLAYVLYECPLEQK